MARFYVHGVQMYAYSDETVMTGDEEARSRLADDGADAVCAVARGAPVQAGLTLTRDSTGLGGPQGRGSTKARVYLSLLIVFAR